MLHIAYTAFEVSTVSAFNRLTNGDCPSFPSPSLVTIKRLKLHKIGCIQTLPLCVHSTPLQMRVRRSTHIHFITPHNTTLLFNQAFSRGQYVYCKDCKTIIFTECLHHVRGAGVHQILVQVSRRQECNAALCPSGDDASCDMPGGLPQPTKE